MLDIDRFNELFQEADTMRDKNAMWWKRVEDGGATAVLIDRVSGKVYYRNYFDEITMSTIPTLEEVRHSEEIENTIKEIGKILSKCELDTLKELLASLEGYSEKYDFTILKEIIAEIKK